MTIDFSSYLGAVTRTVTELEKEGVPARNVKLERSYHTTTDDLWDAVTNPERLPRWFLPVSGELKLGGRYQFDGNAGGTITACVQPEFVAGTWEFGPGVSWVEVRISPVGDGQSRLSLSHICPINNEHWDRFGAGAVGVGWDIALAFGLDEYLTNPTPEPFDENAFATSPEGTALITSISEDWERASIAGGLDPEWANLVQRRTSAFYTGQEFQEE
ncbi:MAG: SRPBCC family protein [Thermomicrobiales bacterium]